MTRQPAKHLVREVEAPGKGEGIQLQISGDSNTVVDWINGMARQRSAWESVGEVQKTTAGMVEQDHHVEMKGGRLGDSHLSRAQ